MNLMPAGSPGRKTRKARAYADQIQALAAAGYSHEDIRQALHAVGIAVSKSTVQREVSREAAPGSRAQAGAPPSPPSPSPPSPATTALPLRTVASEGLPIASPGATSTIPSTRLPGHAIAEAFFDANPSSPLLYPEEIP